jgi:hypothetical protein
LIHSKKIGFQLPRPTNPESKISNFNWLPLCSLWPRWRIPTFYELVTFKIGIETEVVKKLTLADKNSRSSDPPAGMRPHPHPAKNKAS